MAKETQIKLTKTRYRLGCLGVTLKVLWPAGKLVVWDRATAKPDHFSACWEEQALTVSGRKPRRLLWQEPFQEPNYSRQSSECRRSPLS